LIADAVSEELGEAILIAILNNPDLIGLAYTGGDSESDEILASIVDEDGTGVGLAANGEGLILLEEELAAAFPVPDIANFLIDVFTDLAAERFGSAIALDELTVDAIEGIIEDMDTLVFAVEPAGSQIVEIRP
jgi:hypothetical protein